MARNLNQTEAPRESVDETRRDLDNLRSEVSDQQLSVSGSEGIDPKALTISHNPRLGQKIENLSKDSVLQSGMRKIIEKGLESRISTFEKEYKKNEDEGRLGIESWTRTIISKHPELQYYICGELGLPYQETVGKRTKFSKLTFEQKLGFMAVYYTLWNYNNDASKFDAKTFIEKCNGFISDYSDSIAKKLEVEISNNAIFEGPITGTQYVKLGTVLKNSFGLTDTECEKMKDYMKLLQEYQKSSGVQEAGLSEGKIRRIIFGLGIVVGIFGVLGVKKGREKFTNRIDPTAETKIQDKGGEVTLTETKEVFEGISMRNRYDTSQDGKRASKHYEEKAVEFKKDGRLGFLNDSFVEKTLNWFEGRKIDLYGDLEVGYVFDMEGSTVKVKKNRNGKGEIIARVKKPKPEVMKYYFEVTHSNREKIFNLDKFDNFEIRAMQSIIDETLIKAKQPEEIEKARKALEKGLKQKYDNTGIAPTEDTVILAGDVEKVKVEWID